MSNTIENYGNHQFVRQNCRVAYTINNTQPVICTIIGDQPLFYMDHDVAEDDMEDIAALGIMEQELDVLRKEIKSLERLSSELAKTGEQKISSFYENFSSIKSNAWKNEDMKIEKIIFSLSQSRLAKSYIEFAAQNNVTIEYCGQVDTAFYDREAGKILINPALNIVDQQLLLAQELRRHWQHRAGALIHPLMFHPDNAILVNRAQIADLAVSVIRIGWELQLSGEKAAWERIENSSMADLARAFAREAFLDFRTINNGLASAAVFECWFLSERCRAQDKLIINQMLADYQGYVFELEHATQAITPTLIAALGSMPFGKNYLAEHAATITSDAIFTDVRDRSNANFLWFIKFERSFRETEHELQHSTGPSAGDVLSPAINHPVSKHEPSAQIVQLHPHAHDGKSAGAKGNRPLSGKDDGKQGSNVVYLRRWSAE